MQAYNLGYDASEDAVPKAGYAIHHPAGNFARISSFNQTSCAHLHPNLKLLKTPTELCWVLAHSVSAVLASNTNMRCAAFVGERALCLKARQCRSFVVERGTVWGCWLETLSTA